MATDIRVWLRDIFGGARIASPSETTAPEQEEVSPSEREQFLAGQWVPVTIHDQPGGIAYQAEHQRLYVQFPDSTMYTYDYVTPSEALSLLEADHKGGWVWSHLRVRGTLGGFQKPFAIVSDPNNVRIWSKTKAGRERHALVPPSGDTQFPGYNVR